MSDAILRYQAKSLLRALRLHDSESNLDKVVLVLANVERAAKAEQAASVERMRRLLEDGNKMVARMATKLAAAGIPATLDTETDHAS